MPLSETAARCLQEWRSNFPEAQPDHAVFPRESYRLIGQEGIFGGKFTPYEVFPAEPIGSWKGSWSRAKKTAKVECRWHDLGHTFVSRVAEGQASDVPRGPDESKDDREILARSKRGEAAGYFNP